MINKEFIGRSFRIEGRTITVAENISAKDLEIVAKAFPDVKVDLASAVVTTEAPKITTLNPVKKDDTPKP